MDKKEQIKELLTRGVEQVIVQESLAKKLSSGKKLRVKLGIDPTSAKMHLGHTVVLRKLKQFMALGHQVIFLVGDFTARIGDPSGKLSARKSMEDAEIKENVATYREQVGKVLDISKVEFRFNSEWHKNMDFAELFRLASLFSVNQMLERDMFQKRMAMKRPLWIHELIYPILQGYDSVALQADVELGGTDQTFNVLSARTIQPDYGQPPQDIMTVQLLEGTDGKEKMSKSVGNTINLTDSPHEIFGKAMSLPDHLIIKYFTLLTDISVKYIEIYSKAMKKGANPKGYKVKLAKELVRMYHGSKLADQAEQEFEKVFKNKEAPSEMVEWQAKQESYSLIDLLTSAKLSGSKSEARRLIEQGAVSVDKAVIKDWRKKVKVKNGMVLKVGKRKFVRITK